MYDAWLDLHREGRTIVRLQMNFLQNQSDPQLPELKERLRNQFPVLRRRHDADGRDRRVGRAARERRGVDAKRSGWWARPDGATKTPCRTSRA